MKMKRGDGGGRSSSVPPTSSHPESGFLELEHSHRGFIDLGVPPTTTPHKNKTPNLNPNHRSRVTEGEGRVGLIDHWDRNRSTGVASVVRRWFRRLFVYPLE